MEEETLLFPSHNPSVFISQPQIQSILQLNGSKGDVLFTIKPNGEFVPGPGLDREKSLDEFSKFIYKNIQIFGKSFAETLNEKNKKIKDLEEELYRIKSKEKWDMK